jgi:hypothetical protein
VLESVKASAKFPGTPSEVYNLGGGFENSCSVLEAFALAAEASGREQVWTDVESIASEIISVTYSDLTKMKTHYPRLGHHQEPETGCG